MRIPISKWKWKWAGWDSQTNWVCEQFPTTRLSFTGRGECCLLLCIQMDPPSGRGTDECCSSSSLNPHCLIHYPSPAYSSVYPGRFRRRVDWLLYWVQQTRRWTAVPLPYYLFMLYAYVREAAAIDFCWWRIGAIYRKGMELTRYMTSQPATVPKWTQPFLHRKEIKYLRGGDVYCCFQNAQRNA